MPEEKIVTAKKVEQEFTRKAVSVHEVFRDPLAGHLVDGKIADKQKLEQDKLKISAKLVNFVVAGGVLFFSKSKAADATGHEQEGTGEDGQMDEASLFQLLEKTIRIMLDQLNQPDVNMLKISLSKSFRSRLQEIFTKSSSVEPDRFPVKIFIDTNPETGSYIGINMRNIRSLGEDINRIERDEKLQSELVEHKRSVRHTDGDLARMFAPASPEKS